MDSNMGKGCGGKDRRVTHIKVNMHLIGRMDMENSNGEVVMPTKAITRMTKERDMGRWCGLMGVGT
jgi:hypothetical protein